MEENEKMNNREELFSRPVRAGKRTYFFDVKATRGDEKYITITESKRRFSNEQNRFFYENTKFSFTKKTSRNLPSPLRKPLILLRLANIRKAISTSLKAMTSQTKAR